ncbi:unnamed protein product [Soboliphyme baturini]|uniref:DUF4456 domain-containing protein n=1 Tax=Soboliphyme baturini TaxID=241478 RepID=A0A183J5J0_9BILA|nr:unnamed protein product [Soboliphyme baturini]
MKRELKQKLSEPVATLIKKYGRGIMKSYAGEKYKDWFDDFEEHVKQEESLIATQMDNFLKNDSDYERVLNYEKIPSCSSIAVSEYQGLTKEFRDSVIGLQYMVEIRPPAQSMPAYYCILCNYITTSWEVHCSILRHCIAYFMKHYKSIYECVALESSNEQRFRKSLTLAKANVLQLEGYLAKLHTVILLKAESEDSFIAINSNIAERIGNI